MGRVALLGIAQRQSRTIYQVNSRCRNLAKTLSMNIKTTGDWLKVKRIAKNLTPSHVATKMGIATSLVYSLENNNWQPDIQMLKSLAQILEFDVEDLETAINKTQNAP
jgi:ribosome-binding protein aMBF1 (putative translation factor)